VTRNLLLQVTKRQKTKYLIVVSVNMYSCTLYILYRCLNFCAVHTITYIERHQWWKITDKFCDVMLYACSQCPKHYI